MGGVAAAARREDEESSKDKSLHELATSNHIAIAVLSACLAPLATAVKTFETASVGSVLGTMASAQSLLIALGGDEERAVQLLSAAYDKKAAFSGTVGHRNNIPRSKQLPERLLTHYGVPAASRGQRLVTTASSTSAETGPLGAGAAGAELTVPTHISYNGGIDSHHDIPNSLITGEPASRRLERPSAMPDKAALSASLSTALLAGLMAYGMDAASLAGVPNGVYTRAAILNPAICLNTVITRSTLSPPTKARMSAALNAESRRLADETKAPGLPPTAVPALPPTDILDMDARQITALMYSRASEGAARAAAATDMGDMYYYTSKQRHQNQPASEKSVDLAMWWYQHRLAFPRLYHIAIRAVMASASSSDAERAGSTTQAIIGEKATSMGMKSLQYRTLVRANSKECLDIANRRVPAATVAAHGGTHMSRVATIPFGPSFSV